MTIIVDGMGGDNAPLNVLQGCAAAVAETGVDIIVTGPEDLLKKTVADNAIPTEHITFRDAASVITMEDEASSVLRAKKDSSMGVAFALLNDGAADAMVSGGNSGCVLTGATLIVKRIPGIHREAFASVFPTKTGYSMLLDCGANEVCTADYLNQFGTMGALYMKHAGFCSEPRVGLLNNGTEECKGPQLYQDAHRLLAENKAFRFVGNIEARGAFDGTCDVIVADGFSGNVMLKAVEGTGAFMMDVMKGALTETFFSKLCAAMLKPQLRKMKHRLDYTEVGGGLVLGACKPVIKAHGSSNAKAFKNAIRQATKFAESGTIDMITQQLASEQGAKTN